jgi:predicted nucleic acid-binding protein
VILVDTTVWSLAFRRRSRETVPPAATLLARLIHENAPLALPGIVLQEVLSGVRNAKDFQRLGGLMASFPTILASTELHSDAAALFNACVRNGLNISAVDALIAATAVAANAGLLTTDDDFRRIAQIVPLNVMHIPGNTREPTTA